jgi:hypothetical protein
VSLRNVNRLVGTVDHGLAEDCPDLNPPARIGLVGSRDGVVGEVLFNEQQSALSVPVEGIYGVEQALTLDQPGW